MDTASQRRKVTGPRRRDRTGRGDTGTSPGRREGPGEESEQPLGEAQGRWMGREAEPARVDSQNPSCSPSLAELPRKTTKTKGGRKR